LGKAIHAFADFDEYISVVCECCNVVFFHDVLWNYVDWDEHVLISFHFCFQVEVFAVEAEESCIGCGDEAVEEDFGSGHVSIWCVLVPRVIDLVAWYCELDAVWISFLGAEVGGSA